MSGLADMSWEMRRAVQAAICPGCKFNLPEVYHCGTDAPGFTEHSLPGTDFKMRCVANSFRRAIFEAQSAAEANPEAANP